ncbi:MAG TPA: KUP/HAK/KT family potassium transporter [Dissulfurispiraceae bacterium]|nr:KUP/HAK/KT family potassium transporter [Dissulfurispiraceae bacterium]
MLQKESAIKGIIRSFGLVFGDIGTSPIYTLTVIILLTEPTEPHVMGALSLIVWSLIIIVTVEYAWLAMSLSRKGEGGTIVLRELLIPLLKSPRQIGLVTLLSFVGISLLVGDGVITPAISILSAVEGSLLIPGLEKTGQTTLLLIAGAIAIALFSVQKKGTGRVAGTFGPVMVVWFSALAVSGVVSILQAPQVLKAVNPYYALMFFAEHGLAGILVLSQVILCATGGEALYADMGHLGRKPILRAWSIVSVALVLNYLGQGAYVITHPGVRSVLYEMILSQAQGLYVPFLLLSIIATIIASQAMISGLFSIVYQGITTHVMPLFKVDYTSEEMRSQIYIGSVNWFLLAAVLFVMYEFRESSNLAHAYGLAVNGDMVLTAFLMTWIFFKRGNNLKALTAILVMGVVLVFLVSNVFKIPHGGYWSIILAAIPFTVILIYTKGQKRLYKSMQPMELSVFLERYRYAYKHLNRIQGTALFFARDVSRIPPYMVRTMLTNKIIYENNIIVSLLRRDDPFGVTGLYKCTLAEGLCQFEIQFGYMEVFDVEEILREEGIDEDTIFYGLEDIVTTNVMWKGFNAIKRLTPTFVQFYKLPANKLHGVITRVEM